MRELRFGVVGCGGMGTLHCSNASFVPGLTTVAYCDVDLARAEKFLAAYGGEYATTDMARVFGDASIDGVLVQTGEVHHPRVVTAAARAGKHIFCEKPLARTLAEAREAAQAVDASGVKMVFGVCNRLAPMVRRAKGIVPNPHYTFCQCSDTVTGQAVHNLDLAVNLFHEAPLVRVYAQGAQVWNYDPHLPVDSFVATLTFADESVHCYIQHGGSRNGTLRKYSYQLFGKDRCVFLAERFKKCIVHDASGTVTQTMSFEGPDFGGQGYHDVRGPIGYMGHYDEIAHLADCIRNDGQTEMTVRHGVRVLAVEKAILESCVSGAPVDFPAFCRANGIEAYA
ncbi:Gfo/Idh/MocA family oxidoreductase [Candidatus Poribacteria bacterium]|nr:Gfo/Idh/MocA family oxidoreductase [Candidatus Poribacteria bacterium]